MVVFWPEQIPSVHAEAVKIPDGEFVPLITIGQESVPVKLPGRVKERVAVLLLLRLECSP